MNIKGMSDEEIVEAINEALKEDGRIMTDYLEIECNHGKPVLNGRVPDDKQIQIADEVLNDVLDIHEYENHIWVDDELAFEDHDAADGDVEELSFEGDDELDSSDAFNSDDDE